MRRTVKAYLPRWILWALTPVLVAIWTLITWMTFFTPHGRDEPGVTGWAIMTAVTAGIGIMMWLMASRRLPAYILEFDDADEEQRR